MSAQDRNFLQRIKDYRKFVDFESPSDSDNDEMASPQVGKSPSDSEAEKVPVKPPIKDSGIEDPTITDSTFAPTEFNGPRTSTPKPGANSSGRGSDCVYEMPGGERQQYELADDSLEGGMLNTMSVNQTKLTPDEMTRQYDFSDRVNVDTSLLSGPETSRPGDVEGRDLPPELQGDLPCDIFYLNENLGIMQSFKTFNELSEYLVDAAVQVKGRTDNNDYVLRKLVRLPLDALGCYLTVGEYLRYLYEADKLMDVVVHVQDKTFSAHRVALSCYSEYFADLFNFNMGKKIPFEMRLKGIYPEAFAVFLEFVYTGKLNIYDAISADMIIIADFLKVDALKQRCTELSSNLPLEQALKLVVKCQGGTSGRIYRTVFHKCIQNFSDITKLPGILEMDIDTFCQMLASDDLFVHTEYEVFQMAVRWIAHDIEERVKYAMRIINLIRFQFMTREELYSCAETTSLIRGYDKFREAILKANWILTGRLLKRDDPFNFPMLPPRNCYMTQFVEVKARPTVRFQHDTKQKMISTGYDPPSTAPPMTSSAKHGKPVMIPANLQTQARAPPKSVDILVIGGFQTDQDKFVERYDSEDNQWVHFCRLPEPRIHHAVAVQGNTLYLIGGSDPRTPGAVAIPTNKTFSLDLITKEWKRVADMSIARMDHCACCLSGMIFAIGGRGLHANLLGSVECYNPTTDNWFFVAPLANARASASAISLKGKIFVVGGLGENDDGPTTKHVLNTVEIFDSSRNSWSNGNNLRFPRSNACLVNVRDRLFLCGGATRSYDYQSSVLVSVAAVDEYIEEHDMWCHRSDMIIPRHDAGVTIAGDRIYIVGGISSTADRVLQSVECYDTRQALWLSGVQDLPYPTRWICCVSVLSKWQKPNYDTISR